MGTEKVLIVGILAMVAVILGAGWLFYLIKGRHKSRVKMSGFGITIELVPQRESDVHTKDTQKLP